MRLTWSRATGRPRSEREAFQGESEPRARLAAPGPPSSSWSGSWASWPPSRTVTGYLPGPRLAFPEAVRRSMRGIRAAVGATTINPELLTCAEKLRY